MALRPPSSLPGCLAVAAALLTASAGAQEAPQESAGIQQQRAELARVRAQVIADFAAREQACRERFFVNFCLRDVTGPRREALARLRQQEIQFEEAERRRRQAQALERISQKREAAPPASPPAR